MPKLKYYVVWKGNKRGIFNTWDECAKQVKGFSDAEYKAFENPQEAEIAFKSSYEDYIGRQTSSFKNRSFIGIEPPIEDSYCVDASCIGNPGPMEYRCVHTTSGKRLFQQGPFENGTNNIGEFLALVHALSMLKKQAWNQAVYTDSETAMAWVKNKKCKTQIKPDERNHSIFELISRAEKWLAENEYTTKILKWNTEAWGEIPADYGRK